MIRVRAFKRLGMLALAAAGMAPALAKLPPADLVLTGGYVYTADAADTIAQALAVTAGRIVYVGSSEGAETYVGPRTRRIDLQGRMAMPGLIDGHLHPQSGGLQMLGCNLNYERLTIANFQARIQACLDREKSVAASRWLQVINWFQQDMIPTGVAVTHADLDRLETSRPIIVSSSFGHSSLLNQRALELARINRDTPDPKDGVIRRDAAGEPTGLLEDAAQSLASGLLPKPSAADNLFATKSALAALREQGITSFLDASTDIETLTAFRAVMKSGGLTARGHFAVLIDAAENFNVEQSVAEVVRERSRFDAGDRGSKPSMRIHTAKLFLDGVITAPAFTGVMLEPYFVNQGSAEQPLWRPGDFRGPPPYFTDQQLQSSILKLAEAGIDPHMHADGDGAVRQALDAVEAVRKSRPDLDFRPAIAHDEVVHPADFARYGKLNVLPVLSFQWGKPAADSMEGALNFLGPYRHALIEPTGLLAIYGARVVYGSDWPVDPLNLWFALKVAVTRVGGPEDAAKYGQRLGIDPGLSVRAGVRAMTIDAAYSLRQDATTGSLEIGKYADLIVLDRNLFEIAAEQIAASRVEMTLVGGELVYQRK